MTTSSARTRTGVRDNLRLALQALRTWTPRQIMAAIVGAVVVGVVIGVATVLIPNPIFGRDIPPVWWNYPVWIVTSALSGMLIATYVRPYREVPEPGESADDDGAAQSNNAVEAEEKRTSRMGMAGGILAWFAVGCPVCNKLALLALGYSGAITWFTPLQPFLAVGALILTGVALVWRLRGQVACPVTPNSVALTR